MQETLIGADLSGTSHHAGLGVLASLSELIALRAQAQASPARHMPSQPGAPGLHPALQKSRGMEFAESRPYQSGDDARALDWRQTARRGRPYTKLFHQEHERPLQLLVDLGPNMRFGTRVAFKSVLAARVAALLAWRAVAAGDRVGGLVCNGASISAIRPQGHQYGVLALLGALAGASAAAAAPASSLAAPLHSLVRSLRPGSQIVIVSDFATLDASTQTLICALARSAELLLLQIYDRFEAQAPPPGRYPVTDGQRRLILDLHTRAARSAYGAAFAARQRALEQLALRSGATLQPLATHQAPGLVLRPVPSHRSLWRSPGARFAA